MIYSRLAAVLRLGVDYEHRITSTNWSDEMKDQIEVEINVTESMKVRNPSVWEGYVVGKLKEAGIPIKGTLLYAGLESGTLHRLDDPCDFGKYKYVWFSEEATK